MAENLLQIYTIFSKT